MAGRQVPGRRSTGRHRAPGRASWRSPLPTAHRRLHAVGVVTGALLVALTGGLTGASAAPVVSVAVTPVIAAPASNLSSTGPATPDAALHDARLRAALDAHALVAAREEARAMAEAARAAAEASVMGFAADDPALAPLTSALAVLDRASAPATHGPMSDGRTQQQVTAELERATDEVFAAAQKVWAPTEDAGAIEGVQWVLPESLATLESAVAALADRSEPVLATGPRPRGDVPSPDELCPVPFAPSAVLRCDAAADLGALNDLYRAEHGTDLVVTSAFRTFAQQVSVKASRGALAATPGTSNHEVGVAVDLGGMGGLGEFDAPAYLWMKDHAAEFGWYHPAGMEPGGSGPEEPWHWEYGR